MRPSLAPETLARRREGFLADMLTHSEAERLPMKTAATSPLSPVPVRRLLAWFAGAARDLPWRRTANPYAIWISEIMLQQTQVHTVLPYWERWMKALPTVRHLARARPSQVLKLWEGLGYYRRARHLQAAARVVMESHAGRFPSDYSAILSLPGIGPYTAGAICSIAYNQPTPILDGNVLRVLARFHGIRQPVARATSQKLLWRLARLWVNAAAALPNPSRSTQAQASRCSHLNQGLMELGALVCTPKNPRCGSCPLQFHCAAHRLGLTARIPRLAQRAKTTSRHFAAAIVRYQDTVLLHQRPEGTVNGGLWEFPNVELSHPENGLALEVHLREKLRLPVAGLEPVVRLRHSITRYRILLDAFAATLSRKPGSVPRSCKWVDQAGLDRLPLSGAHRKIARWVKSP